LQIAQTINRGDESIHRIIGVMALMDFFIKVEAELDDDEDPKRFAAEICRVIAKSYGVRSAEVSNFVSRSEP
jgi:hypothetical protein